LSERADVTRFEPAVAQHFLSSFRLVQVAFENVYSAKPEHSCFMQRRFAIGFRLANLRRDPGRHPSDRSQSTGWLHLFAGRCRLWLGQIGAHDRRSFSETVTFEDTLVEPFFDTLG